MKILLSAFQCSPVRGSEPGTGWNWARSLADMGHEVTIITAPRFRDEIRTAGRDDIDFQYVDYPSFRLQPVLPRVAVYDVYLRWQEAILAHARQYGGKFDVVHHVVWAGLHLGTRLWQLPAPCVFGPVGGGQVAPGRYWRYFGRTWPAELLRSAATGTLLSVNRHSRDAVRNSAVTLVCNSDTEAAVRRLGGRDIRYMMADGLADEAFGAARAQPSGVPTVLFAGRLIARKAPALAVEAFAELRRHMAARLVIAGDGPLRGQVLGTARRLGVAGDVDLLGMVPLPRLRGLYDSASALLFTSLRESFGSPVLEAFGRGLPVVAMNIGGIADVDAGTAAVRVPLPADPRRLAPRLGAALATVLTDGTWDRRSSDGIAWADGWRWSSKARAATAIYEEIAG